MILLVDVGNTNIVIGVYKENECIVSWRISTDTKKLQMNIQFKLCNYLINMI